MTYLIVLLYTVLRRDQTHDTFLDILIVNNLDLSVVSFMLCHRIKGSSQNIYEELWQLKFFLSV